MNAREAKFVATVRDFYTLHGRHSLPWRQTTDPYLILVSEIMLQQTQVERVLVKYEAFISSYPTVQKLAGAPLRDVLALWQGLGYNRRAKALREAAKQIINSTTGEFPTTREAILQLPGVGPYTTGAILAFAFNTAIPMIETNIRTVYLHHFYKNKSEVSDRDLMSIIDRTLDKIQPRTWYYALMDYGSYLKKTVPNPSKRSKHHVVQSKFVGSTRQIRGAIMSVLLDHLQPQTAGDVMKLLATHEPERVAKQLQALVKDGLVLHIHNRYQLPT